jgi:D-xylose 1-dehydrogenase (NADP+, D-xylono-1,5-lactone-forming)
VPDAHEPVRLGLLSTARINARVLAAARDFRRVEVVAVASRDRRRAEDYAREHGVGRAHGSYEDLLSDPEVEAVYVSLPNALHVEWSIRALEAGKHVLCEKPLDRRPDEVERAFDAAEQADRFLLEAFMYRHHPQAGRLGELVEDGAIGELRLLRGAFSFPLTDLGNVRMRPDLDGGALMDVGCYCVHALRFLAGEPEVATGEQVLGSTGVDVRFAGTLRFSCDVVGHFDCGFDLPARRELEAVGSDGVLSVLDPWLVRETGLELRRADGVERIPVEDVDPFACELENLAGAIRGLADPLLGRRDAVGQARALEALYRSAREGFAVELA